MQRRNWALGALLIAVIAVPGWGSETITYSYDAKGRLVKTVRTGSINNGLTTEVSHDKADNRSRVKVAGASK